MKTQVEINNIVKNTVVDVLGLDYTDREELTTTTDFVSHFGADSLDIIEITITVIRNTGVKLTTDQEDALCEAITKKPMIETITNFIMNGNEKQFAPYNLATLQGVQQILSKHFNKPETEITPNTHLCKDLGADSLDKYELRYNLEDKFNIKFSLPGDNQVLKNLERTPTVGEIVKAIEDKKKQTIKSTNQKSK